MKEKLEKLVALGVTAQTIAAGIGCSKSTVCNWLAGRRNISEDNEKRLRVWLEEFKTKVAAI